MPFDNNEKMDVEGMSEAEFGVWKAQKYNEVSYKHSINF